MISTFGAFVAGLWVSDAAKEWANGKSYAMPLAIATAMALVTAALKIAGE